MAGSRSQNLVLVGLVTLVGGCWDPLDTGADGTRGLMLENVEFEPGIEVDVFVNAYGNIGQFHSANQLDRCQFAIHGGVFAAASWRPYAEGLGKKGCVLSADMPVRGNSGNPEGGQLGDLDLFSYVNAYIEILDRLQDEGVEPKTILGHSMGGTLTQMIQQQLVDQGTNMHERWGIDEAILVASDLPAEVPWALGDGGGLSGLIEAFAVNEPEHGVLFEIPVDLWPAFYFTDLDGNVVPNALTPAQIEAGGFNALGEPLQAIHQLNGTGGFISRPSADANLFKHKGTRLRAIAYEQDIYVQLGESETLYQHLTSDAASHCFVPVFGPDTVHTVQFSNPQALIGAIASSKNCHYNGD